MTCFVVLNLLKRMEIEPKIIYVKVSKIAATTIGTTA